MFSFRPLPATPAPIAGKLTLVLAATSQIFCFVVATPVAGQVSRKTHCPAVTGSHNINESSISDQP